MVEKFRKIVDELIKRHGGVYIFAIVQMDELFNKWSVILSASWITDENRTAVFEEVRGLLIESLNQEEVSAVARISIFNRTEHLIDELLKYQRNVEINDQKVNGNIIHKGYILESNLNPHLRQEVPTK